ncbi:MAG: cytochrome b/b6 domain-containing protein [Gemmatimonadetes bacterium]|nr:cytochrome b/b6 domain-containing protein [Gemmatimonadota bacterium]
MPAQPTPPWEPYAGDLDRTVVMRLTIAERVQHIVLMVSFTVLIVTGVPLLFPETPLIQVWGGVFSVRTFLHRFAGVTLAGLAAFHVLYVLFSEEGRRDFGWMAPRLQDVKDFVHYLKYQLGKVHEPDEPPPFGKFNPFEKIEYFAVVWGSAIMVATGFMMWFFEVTLRVFPKWVYDLVLLIHGYEALLAFLSIILWHLYNVHLKPGVFPLGKVWIDGKITLRDLKEHHPREYRSWLRRQRIQPPDDAADS